MEFLRSRRTSAQLEDGGQDLLVAAASEAVARRGDGFHDEAAGPGAVEAGAHVDPVSHSQAGTLVGGVARLAHRTGG